MIHDDSLTLGPTFGCAGDAAEKVGGSRCIEYGPATTSVIIKRFLKKTQRRAALQTNMEFETFGWPPSLLIAQQTRTTCW